MPKGVYIRTEEHKRNISEAKKGTKLTEEHKKKLSDALMGNKRSLGYKHTEEAKKKIGLAGKNRNHTETNKKRISETCKKIGLKPPSRKGAKHTEESNKKNSDAHKGKSVKEKHWNWKGGITPINVQIRRSLKYTIWRRAVLKRDNYQCIWGGKEHGNKLQADHIKPFALFPDLRFSIDNGRTLCVECHKKTDSYGGRKRRTIII